SAYVVAPPLCLHSFPNTTLFRSISAMLAGVVESFDAVFRAADDDDRLRADVELDPFADVADLLRAAGDQPGLAPQPVAFGFHDGDRKSTRLNSGHVKISYAVFCL